MTKYEAISAMKQGKKVQHRYFTSDEWITMHGNKIIFENGASCYVWEFWEDRIGSEWSYDWSILTNGKEDV